MVNYLAGEYHLFNLREFEKHLFACSACQKELAGQKGLNRFLAGLPDAAAPPDFTAGIIDAISSFEQAEPAPVRRSPTVRLTFIRDLVAAAAVTLVLFWTGGSIFEHKNVSLAGQKLNSAVQLYMRTSEGAFNRAYDTLDNLGGSFNKGVK